LEEYRSRQARGKDVHGFNALASRNLPCARALHVSSRACAGDAER